MAPFGMVFWGRRARILVASAVLKFSSNTLTK